MTIPISEKKMLFEFYEMYELKSLEEDSATFIDSNIYYLSNVLQWINCLNQCFLSYQIYASLHYILRI